MKIFFLILMLHLFHSYYAKPLYPQENPSREVKSLDGLWYMKLINFDENFLQTSILKEIHEQAYNYSTVNSTPISTLRPSENNNDKEWRLMPVPSSFNDIPTEATWRDHGGWVVYYKKFYIPTAWLNNSTTRIFIRFGSVHYESIVYFNHQYLGEHEGGHLAFEFEATKFLKDNENEIWVYINNVLTPSTIPQGTVKLFDDPSRYPPGYKSYTSNCDYFNYAGIHRSVHLYSTPKTHISDVTVHTSIGSIDIPKGRLFYNISLDGLEIYQTVCECQLVDQDGVEVARSKGLNGSLEVPKLNLWWPHLMNESVGYLYTFKIHIVTSLGIQDFFNLKVGFRELKWNSTTVLLNHKPLYLRGVGKHEDSNLRGRGYDHVTNMRDFYLLQWLGANIFRTSHYPYAEETLQLADSLGFMVISEVPACSLNSFTPSMLKRHKNVIKELVARDYNHPSVIMWSLANEPVTKDYNAGLYFKEIANYTRILDPTRIVMFVTSQEPSQDVAVEYMDVIGYNRYPSWYRDSGNLEVIEPQTITEAKLWHEIWKKPVFVSEYSAGSIAGQHSLPAFMWSEDYHSLTLKHHFKAFNKLRKMNFFFGEMIWNFADFYTPQEYIRPGACVKGLFTRERQPKQAAYVARARYRSIAEIVYQSENDDLFCY